MPKKRSEGPKGIVWKGDKSPEQVEDLNKEAAEARGLTKRGETNRKKLLEGIDPALIAAMRERAEWVRLTVSEEIRKEAELRAPDIIRTYPPARMMPILDSIGLSLGSNTDPVLLAAIAIAFLNLTKTKDS